MGASIRRWAWQVPGGPWVAAGALVVVAVGAFLLGTVVGEPVLSPVGWPLLVVLLALMLGVTPFGVEPTSKAPVRLGRFAFTFGAVVLLTALLAGPLDPAAAAVFGGGLAAMMVASTELMDRFLRRSTPRM